MITTEEQHKHISKFAENRGEAVAFAAVKANSDKALTQCTHYRKIGPGYVLLLSDYLLPRLV